MGFSRKSLSRGEGRNGKIPGGGKNFDGISGDTVFENGYPQQVRTISGKAQCICFYVSYFYKNNVFFSIIYN